jgi:hypothetical protein
VLIFLSNYIRCLDFGNFVIFHQIKDAKHAAAIYWQKLAADFSSLHTLCARSKGKCSLISAIVVTDKTTQQITLM